MNYLQKREKEIAEEQEIIQNSVHKHLSSEKMPRAEFLKKYQNQVRLWEQRVNGGNQKNASEADSDVTYHPQINVKSKTLAKDMKRIEQRVNELQESKRKKI